MNTLHTTKLEKDLANKRLIVTRTFAAPIEIVWRAWTEPKLLDQWWAPKPYRTETKSISFSPGGRWLYAMVSPEGEKHWCKVDFETVEPRRGFKASEGFCDENGNTIGGLPASTWHVVFSGKEHETTVVVTISFNDIKDLHQMIEMGFEAGFAMAHGNLDELLANEKSLA